MAVRHGNLKKTEKRTIAYIIIITVIGFTGISAALINIDGGVNIVSLYDFNIYEFTFPALNISDGSISNYTFTKYDVGINYLYFIFGRREDVDSVIKAVADADSGLQFTPENTSVHAYFIFPAFTYDKMRAINIHFRIPRGNVLLAVVAHVFSPDTERYFPGAFFLAFTGNMPEAEIGYAKTRIIIENLYFVNKTYERFAEFMSDYDPGAGNFNTSEFIEINPYRIGLEIVKQPVDLHILEG